MGKGRLLNAPRLRALLEEARLDAIIAASPANVLYLSGYDSTFESHLEEWMFLPGGSDERAQESFAIVTRAARVTLIVGSGVVPGALEAAADEVRAFGAPPYDPSLRGVASAELRSTIDVHDRVVDDDAVRTLAATLRDLNLEDARLGLESAAVGAGRIAQLAGYLPKLELRDCRQLLRVARSVKTPAELAILEGAAALNERAALEALEGMRVDDSLAEAATRFRTIVAGDGAAFDHFSAGIRGVGVAIAPTTSVEAGDVFCLDVGCTLGGYFADTGITVAAGELSGPLASKYELLRTAIEEVGIAAARPGAAASSVHRAMAEFLAARGIDHCFPHGHGLGLEVRDYPILVPDRGGRLVDECVNRPADLPLEVGNVINLEVVMFLPGQASLEIEITAVIDEHGATPFAHQRRSEPVRVRS